MKYSIEDEVENLGSSKKGAEKEENSHIELSQEQMKKRDEAMSILNSLSSECGCSVAQLVDDRSNTEEMGEMDDSEEEGEEKEEVSEEKGKKLDLYVAQMKSKVK